MDAPTPEQPLARAWLPTTTSRNRFSAIIDLERKVNAVQPKAARYEQDWDTAPDGCTGNRWDLYTPEAVAAYRKAGAHVEDAR